MAAPQQRAHNYLSHLLKRFRLDELAERLRPKPEMPATSIPRNPYLTPAAIEARWKRIAAAPSCRENLLDAQTLSQMSVYERNIENFIGTVKLPVGIAGPLRVNGLYAQGDFLVPLATSEAALVASYSRGANLLTQAGGCTAMLLNEKGKSIKAK